MDFGGIPWRFGVRNSRGLGESRQFIGEIVDGLLRERKY